MAPYYEHPSSLIRSSTRKVIIFQTELTAQFYRIGIKRPRPNYVAHRQPIPESPIVETNGNGNGTDLQGNGTDLLGNLIQIHDLLRDEE